MIARSLTCERRAGSPVTDVATPLLAWTLQSTTRGDAQIAYQVQAGSAPGGSDRWDTGKVNSASLSVSYAGSTLNSGAVVYWQVRVWDAAGNVSAWAAARFEMGLLTLSDWSGALQIGYQTAATSTETQGAALLRKDFTIGTKTIRSARLYATAVGVYRPYLNGVRVGAEELAPGWTNYSTRQHYQTYDVTAMLRAGAANALGMVMGDGWACGWINNGFLTPKRKRGSFSDIPYARCALLIAYSDGSTDRIVSDGTWKAIGSDTVTMDFYNGGVVDARFGLSFSEPSLSASAWASVASKAAQAFRPQAQPCAPIRRQEVLAPIARTNPTSGTYVFDMGANHAGFPQLTVAGASAGQTITVVYAEKLNADGTLHTANLRTARQTITFTCRGLTTETFEPVHAQLGGRYISVSGYPGSPPMSALASVRVSADVARSARFECSDATLNAVWLMAQRSYEANFMSVITDCHQRDERLGWMWDTAASTLAILTMFDGLAYMDKNAVDFDDGQDGSGRWHDTNQPLGAFNYAATGWHSGGYIIPMAMYDASGDASIIARHWAKMKAGFANEPCANKWGDFLNNEGILTDGDVFRYAFACYAAQLMVRAASVMNDAAALSDAQSKLASFTATFQSYISSDGTIRGESQTAYALALAFGLAGDRAAACAVKLVANVQAKGIVAGIVGSKFVLEGLTLSGRGDLALAAATDTTKSGWAQALAQGLTLIPERWDGATYVMTGSEDTNSLGHQLRGAGIAEWLIQRIAGIVIDPAAPGYANIILRPMPLGLTRGGATLTTIRGRVSSHWVSTAKGFAWDFEVPPGCTATITVPSTRTVRENGAAVTFTALSPDPLTGNPRFQVGAGRYNLTA